MPARIARDGKETYSALFDAGAEHDLTALDQLMPHPVYGRNHWVCVLNPSEATFETLKPLLDDAHDRAVERYTRSGQDARGRRHHELSPGAGLAIAATFR